MFKFITIILYISFTHAALPILRLADNYARSLTPQDCVQAVWPQELKDYVTCSGNGLNDLLTIDPNIQNPCQLLSQKKGFQCMPLLFDLENYKIDYSNRPSQCTDIEWEYQKNSMQSSTTLQNNIPIIWGLFRECENQSPGSTTKFLEEPFKQKIMGIVNNASNNQASSGMTLLVLILFYSLINHT